jgi:GxxExxY protein
MHEHITDRVVDAALEVHRALGPGHAESTYARCFGHELTLAKIPHRRRLSIPITYKGVAVGESHIVDFLVDDAVVVELRALDEARLLASLRLMKRRVGFIFDFNVPALRSGILRRVL